MNIRKYVSRTDYGSSWCSTVVFAEVTLDGSSIARKKFTRTFCPWLSVEDLYVLANEWADNQVTLAEKYEHQGPNTRP